MDFSVMLAKLQEVMGQHLPSIFGALAILVIGWLVAVIVRAGLRKFLNMVGINQRISDSTGQEVDVASGVAFGAFILIIIMTLIGVFNKLNLQGVSEPFSAMMTQIFEFMPRLLGGVVLIGVSLAVATVVRVFSSKALAQTKMDEKLSLEAGMQPMSNNLGNMLFWIIILLFIPAILKQFGLEGMLYPIQGMIDKFLNMMPNILGAGVIAFVGFIVAKVLRSVVSNILSTSGVDNLTSSAGMSSSNIKISQLVGTVIFALVLIPTLISALDTLGMEAISGPASDMLSMVLAAVPNIIAAGVILTITFYVAKFASSLVQSLLNGIGFDSVPAQLGFKQAFNKNLTASGLVGKLIIFFAMLFASVEAANRLGFEQVRDIVTMFIEFGGSILLGSVILGIGFWLANLAHSALTSANGGKSSAIANIARIAILGLVLAMGLRAMGLADDIVNMAFGFTLGSVAVAFALAFGLGGREAAGKQLEHWFSAMRKDK